MEGEDDDALLQAAIQLSLQEAEAEQQQRAAEEAERAGSGGKRGHEDPGEGSGSSPDRARLRLSPEAGAAPELPPDLPPDVADDPELLMAIQMSLAEAAAAQASGGAGGSGSAAAAAPPPWAPAGPRPQTAGPAPWAPAAAAPSGGAAAAAAAQPGAAAPSASAVSGAALLASLFQAPQQAQQQRPSTAAPSHRANGGGASSSRPAAAQQQPSSRFPAPPPFPAWWADCAQSAADRAVPADGVPVPAGSEAAALAALAYAVGHPVAPLGGASSGAAAAPGAIPVALGGGPGGPRVLTARACDSVFRSAISGARLGRSDEVTVLAACHARACADAAALAAAGAADAPAGLLPLCRATVARVLCSRLESDGEGDDLYFQGGRHRAAFERALGAGHVGTALVEDMLGECRSAAAAKMWAELLRSVVSACAASSAAAPLELDNLADVERRLRSLDRLTAAPGVQRCLASILHAEAAAFAELSAAGPRGGPAPNAGRLFEQKSVLGPLLSLSTLPGLGGAAPAAAVAALRAIPKYPKPTIAGERDRVSGLLGKSLGLLHAAAHAVLERCLRLRGAPMEAVLAWLAAAVRAGSVRVQVGAVHSSRPVEAASLGGTSDAFAVGVTAVVLRLCRPFLDGAPAKLARVPGAELSAKRWRLDHSADEPLLKGPDRDAADAEFDRDHRAAWRPLFAPAADAAAPAAANGNGNGAAAAAAASSSSSAPPQHMIAECFGLASAALHCCLMPAVVAFERALYRLSHQAQAQGRQAHPDEDPAYALAYDCGRALLLDPSLAGDACALLLFQSAWLLSLARSPDAAACRAAFAVVPAWTARDLGGWVRFVLAFGRADLLSGAASAHLPVSAAVEACCALLSRRDLVPSPLVAAALVAELHSMLSADRMLRGGGGMFGGRSGSAAHDALVGAVLANPTVRSGLAPALVHAYARMDAVEGLDVDQDDFDKFTVRSSIAQLLLQLWGIVPESKEAMAKLGAADKQAEQGAPGSASASASPFAMFAQSALTDLMYVLEDSLGRLKDISDVLRQREEDPAAWAALPQHEREHKERFAEGQERTARGFMRNARTTLALLTTVARDEAIAPAFLQEGTAGIAAYTALHFLEMLLGPKCEQLTFGGGAEAAERFRFFDPRALLVQIAEFALCLEAADARAGGLQRFAAAFGAELDYSRDILEKALAKLSSDDFASLVTAHHTVGLRTFIDKVEAIRTLSRSGSGGAGAASGSGGSGPAAALSADAAGPDPGWGQRYMDAVRPLLLRQLDGPIEGYFSQFQEITLRPEGNTKPKQRRIAREIAAMGEPDGLPLAPGSAIFVRVDGERPDKMRCMVVGPEGTPYSAGAFVFDVLFPEKYPQEPPLLQFDTTAGGRVRFNPNLYADGKVCLSLLGTWHGGHASEKWNPDVSTLYQVLVSVQAMILVDQPWFNEPGADALQGTAEGDRKSKEYNDEIRLHTVRHAILQQLRKPRKGLEDAIEAHFRAVAPGLRRQLTTWVQECSDPTTKQRMQEAVAEVMQELQRLDPGVKQP